MGFILLTHLQTALNKIKTICDTKANKTNKIVIKGDVSSEYFYGSIGNISSDKNEITVAQRGSSIYHDKTDIEQTHQYYNVLYQNSASSTNEGPSSSQITLLVFINGINVGILYSNVIYPAPSTSDIRGPIPTSAELKWISMFENDPPIPYESFKLIRYSDSSQKDILYLVADCMDINSNISINTIVLNESQIINDICSKFNGTIEYDGWRIYHSESAYLTNTEVFTTATVVSSAVPANAKFTDTKVTNTLAKTTKAYVTGTTSSSTNTGTQVFDTGVYLDTTAGQIVATTFKGALSGNASTATALTSSAGTTHIPVRFSNGKPVAVSEILKYNTGGSLHHGDTTISYASGYKYALIFAYYNHNLGKTPEYTHPLAIALVGNMSSTTSYNKKPLTESGPNSLSFTVTNGDIIFNNNGGDNYGYLIIWSN